MSNETQKSAVLAKCENVAPNCGETYTTPKGTALRTNDRQIGDSCNQWRLDEYRESSWVAIAIDDNAPSDSWVWQLAADILGIKQAEQPRQSDALLWECWKESANEKEWSARVRARESDRFNEWLATLPTEPPRPSDSLLWECWKSALMETGMDAAIASTAIAWSAFEAWRINLPIDDPFQADREIIKMAFQEEWQILISMLTDCTNYDFIGAIKRLAGMEVKNG